MDEKPPDGSTRPARGQDAERTPDGTGGHPDEWTGGRQKQDLEAPEAVPEELPELEEDEDSVVRPENS